VYVVEKINKNALLLIFLQGLPFIIWLINLKLRVRYFQKIKRRRHALTEENRKDIIARKSLAN
jgi:hypothetical protein